MRFPLFGIFLTFAAWLTYELKKNSRLQRRQNESFWEREHKANQVRRQPLDSLNYISINPESLPVLFRIQTSDADITSLMEQLLAMSDLSIVNLTGKTNTDLKAEYGVANLPFLTECDNNFTKLCRLLNQLGNALNAQQLRSEAIEIFEFAVFHGSDVSTSYDALAKLYLETGTPDKISSLIVQAEQLNSLMKAPILNNLKNLHQSGHTEI